jgi:desulfoferrodoxin-like iron-binding protein
MTPSNQDHRADQTAGQDQAPIAEQATAAPGSRFRCERCGSEAIVLQPGAAQLTCCGAPLVMTFDGASRS